MTTIAPRRLANRTARILSVRQDNDATAARVLSAAYSATARLSAGVDHDDLAQTVAVGALALVGTDRTDGGVWDIAGAVAHVARHAAADAYSDRMARHAGTVDLQDPATASVLEGSDRLQSWRPVAPDASCAWTEADTLAQAMGAYLSEAGTSAEYTARLRVVDAVERLTVAGRMPKLLADVDNLADLADAVHAAREQIAHEDRLTTHGTWTEGTAALARTLSATTHGAPVARATYTAARTEATGVVTLQAPMPLTLRGMAYWLRTHGAGTTTTADRTTYAPTVADRYADDWAELSTPLAAVRPANNVKRKRDGSVGSPTTMPRRRGTWDGRQA